MDNAPEHALWVILFRIENIQKEWELIRRRMVGMARLSMQGQWDAKKEEYVQKARAYNAISRFPGFDLEWEPKEGEIQVQEKKVVTITSG